MKTCMIEHLFREGPICHMHSSCALQADSAFTTLDSACFLWQLLSTASSHIWSRVIRWGLQSLHD